MLRFLKDFLCHQPHAVKFSSKKATDGVASDFKDDKEAKMVPEMHARHSRVSHGRSDKDENAKKTSYQQLVGPCQAALEK